MTAPSKRNNHDRFFLSHSPWLSVAARLESHAANRVDRPPAATSSLYLCALTFCAAGSRFSACSAVHRPLAEPRSATSRTSCAKESVLARPWELSNLVPSSWVLPGLKFPESSENMKESHFAESLSEPKAPGDCFSSSSWLPGLLWGFIIFWMVETLQGMWSENILCLMFQKKKKVPQWFLYDMTDHCPVQGNKAGLQPGFISCFCKWRWPMSDHNWTTRERANDSSKIKKKSFSCWLALSFDSYGWWCTSKVAPSICRKTCHPCVATHWLHWF